MQPFDESTKNRIYDISKDVYKRFVSKVAESRGKTFEETRALAKGRVWTGKDAQKHGLVDLLGGLEDAVKLAKKRIGVPEDKLVYVQQYPKKKDEIEALLEMFNIDQSNLNGNMAELKSTLGLTPEEMLMNWEQLPESIKSQIRYMLELGKIAKEEKMMMALPYTIDIH
jgi:ClpP class serine protease